MNIILVQADEIFAGQVVLNDRRAAHIVKILRSKPGDCIKVGVLNGGRGTGVVVEASRKAPFFVKLAIIIL